MSPSKKNPKPFTGRRTPGPHGKTVELNQVTAPDPTYVVQFQTKELKIGKLSRLVKDGPWLPHRNPNRDTKRNAKLRRDEPREHQPVERPVRVRRPVTGGRQVLIPYSRKAAPHPWKQRLAAAMNGERSTKTEDES